MSTLLNSRSRRDGAHEDQGPEGNERLTAITGAILLVLFAIEGVTILELSQLIYWHYFVGFLLLGPVCLKIGTTVYRFSRYYTRDPAYVRKGPPQPLLRLLGPFVVLTTLGVMGTGVALGFVKSGTWDGLPLLFLHKASFVLWAGCMTIHVLAYIWRLPGLIASDVRTRRAAAVVGGRGLRWSLAGVALTAGLVFALAEAHLYSAWRR